VRKATQTIGLRALEWIVENREYDTAGHGYTHYTEGVRRHEMRSMDLIALAHIDESLNESSISSHLSPAWWLSE
jgi:hypothetical protein